MLVLQIYLSLPDLPYSASMRQAVRGHGNPLISRRSGCSGWLLGMMHFMKSSLNGSTATPLWKSSMPATRAIFVEAVA
jgi:hypothetical protein